MLLVVQTVKGRGQVEICTCNLMTKQLRNLPNGRVPALQPWLGRLTLLPATIGPLLPHYSLLFIYASCSRFTHYDFNGAAHRGFPVSTRIFFDN